MVGIGSKVGAHISRIVGEYPVRLAFFGSLLLSLIAVLGTANIARDAALYIDIAQRVTEHGPAVAWQTFDWPWFAILLANTHFVLPFSYEVNAYLWCGLFLAGTCALMVDCVRQRSPDAARWACLVVLAMPAVNAYRDDIIREFGFWFFCTLTLWLALGWSSRGSLLRVTFIHLAIVAAAFFRLEALLLWPALGLWQLPNLWSSTKRKQLLQFMLLPVLGLFVASFSGAFSAARVAMYLDLINPRSVLASFELLSGQFANSLVNKYSRDEAGKIIFFGVLASILITFVKLMGPFAVPFVVRRNWSALRTYWNDYRPFAWAALLYLLILVLFFVKEQFMNARYMSFLNLLFVPVLAVALTAFVRQFPRWGKALVVIGLLVMLSNVISTSPGKTHYVEAGRWTAANIESGVPIYYEDGRISYYAGRGYVVNKLNREQAMSPEHSGEFSYFMIDLRANDAWLDSWLAEHKQRVIARFANRKGAAVLVIGK